MITLSERFTTQQQAKSELKMRVALTLDELFDSYDMIVETSEMVESLTPELEEAINDNWGD